MCVAVVHLRANSLSFRVHSYRLADSQQIFNLETLTTTHIWLGMEFHTSVDVTRSLPDATSSDTTTAHVDSMISVGCVLQRTYATPT